MLTSHVSHQNFQNILFEIKELLFQMIFFFLTKVMKVNFYSKIMAQILVQAVIINIQHQFNRFKEILFWNACNKIFTNYLLART